MLSLLLSCACALSLSYDHIDENACLSSVSRLAIQHNSTLTDVPPGCYKDNGKWAPVNKQVCFRTFRQIIALGSTIHTWPPMLNPPYEWRDSPETCSIAVRATSLEAAQFSGVDILAGANAVFEKCDVEGGFGGTVQLTIGGAPESGWSVEVIGRYIFPLCEVESS